MASGRKILVVGSGGREHALALRLLDSPSVATVIVAPGNAGTARTPAGALPGRSLRNATGSPVEVASSERVDLVVVGPEAPLCAGLVDELRALGIPAFGPSREAARLEGSKAFMKDFALRHGIRTARHRCVSAANEAERVIRDFARPPVIKADGLCAGKGVIVAQSHDDAVQAARGMLEGDRFGEAGRRLVIEECLVGEEVSVHAICDGSHALLLPSSQDHKRIGDGDIGPNTGGMGSYSPAPVLTAELTARVRAEVVERTVQGMQADGVPYRGTLYAGLMIAPDGEPFLLEFNVRFGDPEAQALMSVMDGDLAEALGAAARGELRTDALSASARHALCVVLAAEGYPGSPRLGDVIEGVEEAEAMPDVLVHHAGTRLAEGRLLTSGGRVLGVTATGATLAEAHQRAYRASACIRFRGKQHRSDIGRRALGVG